MWVAAGSLNARQLHVSHPLTHPEQRGVYPLGLQLVAGNTGVGLLVASHPLTGLLGTGAGLVRGGDVGVLAGLHVPLPLDVGAVPFVLLCIGLLVGLCLQLLAGLCVELLVGHVRGWARLHVSLLLGARFVSIGVYIAGGLRAGLQCCSSRWVGGRRCCQRLFALASIGV